MIEMHYGEIELVNGAIAKVDRADLPRLLKHRWFSSGDGYACARINGKPIAMHAFLMETPKGFHTDHINHNKLDNRRGNLRIVTPKENILHRRDYHGKGNPFFGKTHTDLTRQKISDFFSKKVQQLTLQGKIIESFKSITAASEGTGISRCNISLACNGKRKTAGGFIWKLQ